MGIQTGTRLAIGLCCPAVSWLLPTKTAGHGSFTYLRPPSMLRLSCQSGHFFAKDQEHRQPS